MDSLIVIMLGALQGLLEWLPVSSSGQSVVLLLNYFEIDVYRAFTWATVLHLGTLLAVMVKFRKDLAGIIMDSLSLKPGALTIFILRASFFSALTGGLVYLILKQSFDLFPGEYMTALIGVFLIITGVILYYSKKGFGDKTIEDVTLSDTVIVGMVQGLAVLPGISRSGVTVSALLLSEVRAFEALKLSFLLSIPAIGGMTLVEVLTEGLPASWTIVSAGVLVSFVTGYASMEALLAFSRRMRFDLFCLAFGFLAILFPLIGLL